VRLGPKFVPFPMALGCTAGRNTASQRVRWVMFLDDRRDDDYGCMVDNEITLSAEGSGGTWCSGTVEGSGRLNVAVALCCLLRTFLGQGRPAAVRSSPADMVVC